MPPVFALSSNIISSLGMDTAAHWLAAAHGRTGIRSYADDALSSMPFMGSRLEDEQWQKIQRISGPSLSPFEQMAAASITTALAGLVHPIDLSKTVFILATTKGNIELLGMAPEEQMMLHHSASVIAASLGIPASPVTIAHACVSGVVALQYGMRVLQSGRYKHAVVTGCDRFSRFVLSGFQSFQALSGEPCKPFDAARSGVTLGEAAATIVLSVEGADRALGQLLGGATSNDANHISGPSRTGAELADAIARATAEAGLLPADLSMISAHGTATIYNDEMEAKAFNLAGLRDCPVHSFKGYVGHTLGAAGVLESVMTLESLRHQKLIPTAGFETLGVSEPLNVTTTMQTATLRYALKTASGFGGCNAALVLGSNI